MITFYFDNKVIDEFTEVWTNEPIFQKLSKREYGAEIHLFIIRPGKVFESPFEVINSKLIGKNYKIILWYLDTSDFDSFYDTTDINLLIEKGEDILVVCPDHIVDEDTMDEELLFNFVNTYSMADAILEQQNLMNSVIQFLFKDSKFYYRQKHFLSLNGTPKPHRFDLVSYVVDNNLLDNFDISFNSYLWDFGFDSLHLDLKDTTPYTSTKLNLPLYFNSYIDIVSMAKFKESGVYLDEKIYKSFACLMPFVIVGQFETLKVLKELGFKTFSPIINEDYDNEKDNEKRMDLVIEEIKRLNNMTHSEIDNMFWEFKGILIHNFKHLKNFINETDDYLIKKICQ